MKNLIYPITFIIIIVQLATAATLYVDNSNAGCSDATITRATNNASNPFCLTNTTAFMQAQNGDVIIVAAGDEPYWQTLAAGYNLNGMANNVVMIAQDGANFTSAYTDFRGVNSYWKNEVNVSDGSKIWNSTRIVTGDTYLACIYLPEQISLFYAPNEINLTQTAPYFPNWSSWWTTTGTDRLKLKLPANIDPNDGGFYCGKGSSIFDITNVNNFTITGGYYIVVRYLVSNGTSVNGLLINDTIITGGVNDNGVIHIQNADNVRITNNEIVRADQEQTQGVWWSLVKAGSSNTETSAIKLQDCDNCLVQNNQIVGYFNGIYLTGLAAGNSKDTIISSNDISYIMDDCLEAETYVQNSTWSYNNCTASYVGFSITPANSSTGYSNFSYNILDINRSILTNSPTHYSSGTGTKVYDNRGAVGWYIHNNLYLWQEGLHCTGGSFQGDNQVNVTWYNNIFYADDNRIDCTGLASSGVSWDYNIYIRTDGGEIMRYINSITNSTAVDTVTEIQAIYTGWNVNSTATDPNFTGGYTPQGLACALGLGGAYVGAVACTYSPVVPVTPSASTNITASCKDALYSSYKGFGTSSGALTLLFVILIGGVIFAVIMGITSDNGAGFGSGMDGGGALAVVLIIAVAGLVLVFVSVFIGLIAGVTPIC